MTSFRDQLLGVRSKKGTHNLQDGLLQIATHTCNLLVQVNNTNNISYGGDAMNIQLNDTTKSSSIRSTNSNNFDKEQLLVLIPPSSPSSSSSLSSSLSSTTGQIKKYKRNWLGKSRLSTVVETPSIQADDQFAYSFSETDDSPIRKWNRKTKWCTPSCIPITLICLLIFLVVVLPLLDNVTEKALLRLNAELNCTCPNTTKLFLIESIPEGLDYTNNSINNPSTYLTWLNLFENAQHTIEIASFYWTLRQSEVYPHPSSTEGETIFQSLLKAGTSRGIKIKIAQNLPDQNNPNIDTELLLRRKAAEVKSLNFARLSGAGVLHTKFIIVDKRHIYLGSANMDWRALNQVKELGLLINDCPCLAQDIRKIFDVYWTLGDDKAKIPDHWAKNLSTTINMNNPMHLTLDNKIFHTYISSSPPSFNPYGRTNDIDALLNVILTAEKFIYISVMDYFPLFIYEPKIKFWPAIDDALKIAAINHNVKIRLLISKWNHSRSYEDIFLKSLSQLKYNGYPRISIEIKRFVVPANKEQENIPFARVNHNKYMVTDNTAYIGTSNWSGDYFTNTAGIAFIFHDPQHYDKNNSDVNLRKQLQDVFERDWNSIYSKFT